MNKYNKKEIEKTARDNLLRESDEIEGIVIKGYDFAKGVNYEGIIDSFSSTGFQASELWKAIDIVNSMIKEKAFIFLGYKTTDKIS